VVPGWHRYDSDPNAPTGGWRDDVRTYASTTYITYSTSDVTSSTTAPTVVYRMRNHVAAPEPARTRSYAVLVEPKAEPRDLDPWEPLHVVLTREALDGLVRRSRERSPPPPELRARHGYQEMARIPCYRGVRTR
jgi:hypothetical protein